MPHNFSTIQDDHKSTLITLASLNDEEARKNPESLITDLNKISVKLAESVDLRKALGDAYPSLWPDLLKLWISIAEEEEGKDYDESLNPIVQAVARFTRNLCAAVPENQDRAFLSEPEIRELIFRHTSYASTLEKDTYPLLCMLVQTLSNVITANEPLLENAWTSYMDLPESQNIILRLVGHPDDHVLLSALIFISNLISFKCDKSRMSLLLTKPSGVRICIQLLDRIETVSQRDFEDKNAANIFEMGFHIFKELFDNGFGLKLLDITAISGEPITPQRTTVLKLMDTYLLHMPKAKLSDHGVMQLLEPITTQFLEFSHYAQNGFKNALEGKDGKSEINTLRGKSSERTTSSTVAGQLDSFLPKVCEALILAIQCLCSFTLASEASSDPGQELQEDPLVSSLAALSVGELPRHVVKSAVSTRGQGSIESIINLLRLVDRFIPRITLATRAAPLKTSALEVPEGVPTIAPSLSFIEAKLAHEGNSIPGPSTSGKRPGGGAKEERSAPPDHNDRNGLSGFYYLKRDLVRLLGILCYNDKAIQDRIRICGGITVVMNLCVIDDRNPFQDIEISPLLYIMEIADLKEHAVFALRNILHQNVENQKVVDAMKPTVDTPL